MISLCKINQTFYAANAQFEKNSMNRGDLVNDCKKKLLPHDH